ncbi:MAG: PAS domain S-box protein [Candidatus Thorarchaeota archaeon]
MEAALILSRFDPLYGPRIVLKAPESLEDKYINKIPSLMELPTKGVFIHIFGKFKTANLFFRLQSPFARGGYESFLISLITESSTKLTLILANELLAGFVQYIINLKDSYRAFDYDPKDFKADSIKLNLIKSFFFSYFESVKPVIKTLVIAEQRYQALFKAARDAIFIINRDTGLIVDVNLEAERLMEKTREDMIGFKALELDLFDEGLVDPEMIKHLINQPPPIISRKKKSSGAQIYLEVSINEIKLADQYFIQFLFHDITDIQITEEKLKEQVKKVDTLNKIISITNQAVQLSDLLKNVRDAFVDLFNLKGCCIYLVDESRKVAKIETHIGFPSYFTLKQNKLDIYKTPYDIVFKKGVALINNNFPEYIEEFLEGIEFSSAAIIPLFSRLDIIGSINMVFNDSKSLRPDEMELIITVGLELGTAIERMQNREKLRESEIRNNILFEHIPFSIFRISKHGILLDIKLDKKIEKLLNQVFSSDTLIGKHIEQILPRDLVEAAQNKITHSLQEHKSVEMKFILPLNDNQIIFQSSIVPLGDKEVLLFLQNVTRIW